MEIMAYDVMSTPAIVINEKVVFKGKVPTKEEVKKILLDTDSCCEPRDSCCDSTNTNCC